MYASPVNENFLVLINSNKNNNNYYYYYNNHHHPFKKFPLNNNPPRFHTNISMLPLHWPPFTSRRIHRRTWLYKPQILPAAPSSSDPHGHWHPSPIINTNSNTNNNNNHTNNIQTTTIVITLVVCLSTNGERALNYTIVKLLILTTDIQTTKIK